MSNLGNDRLAVEVAKLWVSAQDLTGLTPEQVKDMFFAALAKIEKHPSERW